MDAGYDSDNSLETTLDQSAISAGDNSENSLETTLDQSAISSEDEGVSSVPPRHDRVMQITDPRHDQVMQIIPTRPWGQTGGWPTSIPRAATRQDRDRRISMMVLAPGAMVDDLVAGVQADDGSM